MGLVETKRGKGTIVKSTDIDSFNRTILQSVNRIGSDSYYVYEVDRLLEPSIAKLVADRAGESTIRELEDILARMKDSIDHGGTGDAESLAFHKAIYSALDNPFLNTIFELTKDIHKKDRETVFSLTDRGAQTYEEHRKIFEAIRNKDGEKAYKYMDRHLEKVGRTFDGLRDLADSNK
jgi:GntR family transcriptional repressor for pyruvate dehydrogenase complex